MTLRKTSAAMLMVALLGPLASLPAQASNNGGSSWLNWLISLFNNPGNSGHGHGQNGGSVTNLPGPGALGLVVIGLAGTLVVARRRNK